MIFIDEIDAVGCQNGVGFTRGNDAREQTINHISKEMDDFVGNPGIITSAGYKGKVWLFLGELGEEQYDDKGTTAD